MTDAEKQRVRALGAEVAIALKIPAIVLLVYLVLRALLGVISSHDGLVTPTGKVSPGMLALGAAVVVLRLVVIFVLPVVAVIRLGLRLPGKPLELKPLEPQPPEPRP
ncbi:MAG: hypothetical protein U0359_01070 [Byssovorax sp.]